MTKFNEENNDIADVDRMPASILQEEQDRSSGRRLAGQPGLNCPWIDRKQMKKLLCLLLLPLLLSGCNREPTYSGLNVVVVNYTPWSVGAVRVRDHYGDSAGGGSVTPGGGEGSVSCCGSLKGTDFDVYWTAVDDDEVAPHMYDGRFDEFVMKKMTKVHFPPTKLPPGPAPLYFEIHIYPDEHIEFELTRELLNRTRIPIVAVTDWMMKNFRSVLNPDGDPYAKYDVNRAVARIVGSAWKKYRLEDEGDLRQYVYLSMLANPNFDELPQFQRVLRNPKRVGGEFARYVLTLSPTEIDALKGNSIDTRTSHG